MGFARARGAVVLGVQGHVVDVEAHVGGGLPEFRLVGLPDAAVRESRDRVRAALRQVGLALPPGRITVNLAPARLPKYGSSLDVPIACAVAAAAGLVPARALEGRLLVGELSLDGWVRPVEALIPLLLAARHAGLGGAVVPRATVRLARLVDGLSVWGVSILSEVFQGLRRGRWPPAADEDASTEPVAPVRPGRAWPGPPAEDMADVRGQALARRAAEVAAAGGHHLMLVGPPGSGKTMLARRLVGILPPLERDEWLEVLQIHSAAGRLGTADGVPAFGSDAPRPFRAPHHSCTAAGLTGGGLRLSPGELSLAHRGVLFLDEFSELSPDAVSALREPMEDGWVTLVRGQRAVRLPADVLVVAASNPCPCGYYGVDGDGPLCRCRQGDLQRFRRRLNGPVADRFDLWVVTRPVRHQELLAGPRPESSVAIRQRVLQARDRQARRFRGEARDEPFGRRLLNGRMSAEQLRRFCRLDAQAEAELVELARRLCVSARGLGGVLKVARTLADLEGVDDIHVNHIREAFQFRRSGLSEP